MPEFENQNELTKELTRSNYLYEEGPVIKDAFHAVIVAPGLGNTLAEALPQIASQSVSERTTRLLIEQVKVKNEVTEIPTFDEQVNRIKDTVRYSLENKTPCTIVCHSLGALGTIKALSEFSDTELRSINVIMINPVHYKLDTIFTKRCSPTTLPDGTLLAGHPPHTLHLPVGFIDSLSYDPTKDLTNLLTKLGSITVFQSTNDSKYLISSEEKELFKSQVNSVPHGKYLSIAGSHTVNNTADRESLSNQISNEIAYQELRYRTHKRRLMLLHGDLDQIDAFSTEFPETFITTKELPQTIKQVGEYMISMLPDIIYFDTSSVDGSTRASPNFRMMIKNSAERVILRESLQQKKKIESFNQG